MSSGYKFTVYNDKYTAVLTGQTVKIFRKDSKEEIARFKDLKYAYRAAFNPAKNLLVVKSTQPWFAFYCLETMSLLCKMKVKKQKNIAQDSGFCISHDGSYLLNIECNPSKDTDTLIPRVASHLVKYDCETFEEIGRFFETDTFKFLVIERHKDGYLLAGWDWSKPRDSSGIMAFFDGQAITNTYGVNHSELETISPYAEIYYQ